MGCLGRRPLWPCVLGKCQLLRWTRVIWLVPGSLRKTLRAGALAVGGPVVRFGCERVCGVCLAGQDAALPRPGDGTKNTALDSGSLLAGLGVPSSKPPGL